MSDQLNWHNASRVWGRDAAEETDATSFALQKLASHADMAVRLAVAEHPNSALATLMMLAHDRCEDLRYAIAENHQIDDRVLKLLVSDDNPYIAHRAERTLARCAHEAKILALHAVQTEQNSLKRAG